MNDFCHCVHYMYTVKHDVAEFVGAEVNVS